MPAQQRHRQLHTNTHFSVETGKLLLSLGERKMVGFVASLIIMECLAVFLFGSEMYLLSSKLRFILDQNTDYTETAT